MVSTWGMTGKFQVIPGWEMLPQETHLPGSVPWKTRPPLLQHCCPASSYSLICVAQRTPNLPEVA